MIVVKSFSCNGYADFFKTVSPELDKLCKEFFGGENYSFETAIIEAVCNAARYSIYGVDEAKINFRLYISDLDIKVVIMSKTHEFDAKKFRQDLIQLVEKYPEIGNLQWGMYTSDNEDGGRGLWLMLQACQYLILNHKGQEITLIATLPDKTHPAARTLKKLIPRLLIEENGVIS